MISILTNLFPVWAVLFSAIAFFSPQIFVGLKPTIIPLLAVVMFGMGMTLTWDNFRDVIKKPKIIAVGVVMQFFIMPLAAFLIAQVFSLPAALLAGMVLVGTSPGGTASNVICYLAKGDVALSIALTMSSSVLAVAATPMLTWLYLNQIVPVPVWNMFLSVLKIVLIPVVAGVAINTGLGCYVDRVRRVLPLISSLAIVVIIAIIIALNQARIASIGMLLIVAVVLHNVLGLLAGYWVSKSLGYDERTCRTLGIEVGMQNSGLSVALAIKYFSAVAALPGGIFSIWHNLSGSFLAGYWSNRERRRVARQNKSLSENKPCPQPE